MTNEEPKLTPTERNPEPEQRKLSPAERKDISRKLYDSWRDLVALKESMGEKVLELLAHPDCTPEQAQELYSQVLPAYRSTVQKLRKHKPTVLNALKNYPVLFDSVNRVKL